MVSRRPDGSEGQLALEDGAERTSRICDRARVRARQGATADGRSLTLDRVQPLLPREPAPPPPSRTPAPRTKPKLYQLPLLWISYTLMVSLNNEMTKVIGAM